MTTQRLARLDDRQRQSLKLPRGDVMLQDGSTLRRIPGYDIRKLAPAVMNAKTLENILDSAGWYGKGGLLVSASVDATDRFGVLLHISMSYPDHDPSWDLIKRVRAAFFPKEIDVTMVLPKEEDYINVHTHCFHLWQAPETWDML